MSIKPLGRTLTLTAGLGGGSQVLSTLGLLLCAAALGPTGYGSFVFALSLQSYLALLGTLGLRHIIVREAARRCENLNTILGAHIVLTGTTSLVFALIGLGAGWWNGSQEWDATLAIVLVGNIAVCLNLPPFYDAVSRQGISLSIMTLGELFGLTIMIVLWTSEQLTPVSAALVIAGKWSVITTAHYVVYFRWVSPGGVQFSLPEAVRLMKSSWPMMMSSLLTTIPVSFGIFILRWFGDLENIAYLGLAIQAGGAYMLFAALGLRAFYLSIHGPAKVRTSSQAVVTRLYLGYLICLGIGGMGAGWMLIEFWLGADYRPACPTIGLMLIATFILSIGGLVSAYLIAAHRERTILVANWVMALTYVVGCCVLAPMYSHLGAALMSIIAAAVGTAMLIAVLRRS